MTSPLNQYGDHLATTTGSHGGDISSQRIDALDQECLRFALDVCSNHVKALDLGCGRGAQGLRLASLGIEVWMVDIVDISERVARINGALESTLLHFLKRDVRDLTPASLPTDIGIVYSQRSLHYIPYAEARRLLQMIAYLVVPGGRFFLSASGLLSELGTNYPHRDVSVESRFAVLEAEVAAKHQILEPVCLYAEHELSRLGEDCGLNALSVTRSAFGNVKGVFEKPTS